MGKILIGNFVIFVMIILNTVTSNASFSGSFMLGFSDNIIKNESANESNNKKNLPPACSDDAQGKALVIIDMQPSFIRFSPIPQWRNLENELKIFSTINEQLKAIELAKSAKVPIIFIEYDNEFPTIEILYRAVQNYNDFHFFQKTTDGMLNPSNLHIEELNQFLRMKKIKTLITMGVNADACVKLSIIESLENKCKVVTYTHGVAAFNRSTIATSYDKITTNILNDFPDRISKEHLKSDLMEIADLNEIGRIMGLK